MAFVADMTTVEPGNPVAFAPTYPPGALADVLHCGGGIYSDRGVSDSARDCARRSNLPASTSITSR